MSVKVKRERPDQRRHHRVSAPLFVGVAGQTVRAADWSLGGLRIENFQGPVPRAGQEVDLDLTLPFQGFDVTFKARGFVVRNNPETRMFAVQFTDLGERERELMTHFLEELVRGSMVDVEDTIQRIDVPVTPASLEPDSKLAPMGQRPVRRMPAKAMAMSAFYATFGVAVLGYAAMLVYSNFFRLEVQTAVIAAPVETIKAHADGRVEIAGIKPGDAIRQGEVLLSVIDHQLEREIELSDIVIRERKARLNFLKQRFAGELEKLEGLTNLEVRDLQQLKLEVESANARARAAKSQFNRLRKLHDQGLTTDMKLEEAEKEAVGAEKLFEIKKIDLATRIEVAEKGLGKRHYNGRDLIGNETDLRAEMKLAEHEIVLAQQRHIANLNMRERTAVRAPFSGTVVDLPRVDQASVRRGDTIAIVEQHSRRHVLAFLKQDEVAKVGLGDEAQVFIPALGEKVAARVIKIDRTSGFLDEQAEVVASGYRWRGPKDRSAKVVLQFSDGHAIAVDDRYKAGLPVTVLFAQRSSGFAFHQATNAQADKL